MSKVTLDQLERIVTRLNKTTGMPLEPYTKNSDGKLQANIGNYHLSSAYGGYKLVQMGNESGGTRDVLPCGHVSKQELFKLLLSFETGLTEKGASK